MRVYLATSWRNSYHTETLRKMVANEFDVYDFKNPEEGNHGFASCDYPSWNSGTVGGFVDALCISEIDKAYGLDIDALRSSDVLVMLLPCGKSAHLELGYAAGMGKPCAIYSPAQETFVPELMYGCASLVTRTCSHCGAVTGPKGLAGLSVRHWTCTGCGSHHDRDCNAAINTLNVGLGSSHERAA